MKDRIYLNLWLAGINLFISAFTFGGGYVVVPMVKKYYVRKKELFSEEELMEMAAVAQSSPGAIAVNLVALAGYRAGGMAGTVISCVCAVVPPILILSVISLCYSSFITNAAVGAALKGMQAAAAAMIVDFIADMAAMIAREHSKILNLLAVSAFFISFFTEINAILIILGSCLICLVPAGMRRKGG